MSPSHAGGAWVKVMNALRSHPKAMHAGERACWLYVCSLLYSNEQLTDGFIDRHSLPAVAPNVKQPAARARELVVAGLWVEVDGGWAIHDYLEVQESADSIRTRRSRDAKRKRGVHADSTRIPGGVREAEEEEEEEEEKNRSGAMSESGGVTRPVVPAATHLDLVSLDERGAA